MPFFRDFSPDFFRTFCQPLRRQLGRLLSFYDDKDFVLQQKARVLFGISLAVVLVLPLVLIYTVFIFNNTATGVWLPPISVVLAIFMALYLLVKGYYAVSSHLVLITCLTATWLVIYFDPSDPIIKLDTFSYILAILTMTPLIMIKWRLSIVLYFVVNAAILVVFIMNSWQTLGLGPLQAIDFLSDNLMALLFVGITSFFIFSVNKRALVQAQKDLAERRQAEEQSSTAIAFLERSLSSIPEGVLLLDEKMRLSYANPSILNWVGRSEADLIGSRLLDLSARHLLPESDRLIRKNILDRIVHGETIVGAEIYLEGADGATKPLSLTGAGVSNAAGSIIGGIAILIDLTERKRLEGQLRQSQKMEAIGTLAGGIAHDFNNILTSIMGNTELILMHHPENRRYDQKLENIYSGCQRAKDLVGQILAFSRKSEASPQPVSLKTLIKENLKLLTASLPSTIEIRRQISDDDIQVMADPTQIHQIIMNLCTNAHHAMSKQGGVLELHLDAVERTPENAAGTPAAVAGSWARLRVSDTGEGISPDIRDRIFEPYFSTKSKGMGTGLGLAVVHGIVKSYGGAIEVDSKPGKGSTFTVYLPRLQQNIEAASPPADRLFHGNNERVLVIDDEQMVVNFIRDAMIHLGYRAMASTRPFEALALFRSDPSRFDLVITDMTMPGITGQELADQILALNADTPIILCTGYSERVSKNRIAANIMAIMTKPIKLIDLSATVHQILQSDPNLQGTSRPFSGTRSFNS